MSITASQLVAQVSVSGAKEAEAQLLGVGSASEHAGGMLKTLALGAMAAAGAALVGVGVASLKSAADFEQAMRSNVAHAGLAKSQFDSVSQSVLAMASSVGRSPTQLAEALYPILSAFSGIQNQAAKSSIALDTLKMSFQTVAGTTVDGTAVANAAVGTFNALGLATNNVSENTKRMTGLFDVMDKTVQLGNMQWDAYKNVVSKLAVSIQGTTITFNESQAALATLTNEGYSAQRAGTYLSNTFTTMAIKTDTLAKHAKSLGIAFDEQKYSSLDLAGKIEYLNQVTDGNKQKILALLGNNSTALKTFNALSVGVQNYKSNLDALNHAHGALASSFEEASKGFNFQIEQIKAAGEAVLIAIGTKLLPVASQVLSIITPLVTAFGNWISSSNGLAGTINKLSPIFQPLIATLKSFDATGLVYAFRNLGSALSDMVSPIGRVGSAFKGLDLGAIGKALQVGFLQATFQISGALNGLAGVVRELTPTFQEIAGIIGGVFVNHFKTASGIVQELSRWWSSTLMPTIKQAMPAFLELARVVITDVVPSLLKIWAVGQGFIDTVAKALVPILEKAIPFFIRLESVIASGLAPALQFLMPYIVQAAQAIGQFAGEIATRVAPIIENWFDMMNGALTNFLQIWNAVWPYLAPILKGVWDEILGIVKIAWALVKGIVEIGLDILSGNWKQAWEDFKSMLSGVWEGIKQVLKGAWEIIAGWASAAWTLIASAISAPINKASGQLNDTWAKIKNAASSVWLTTKSVITGIVTGIVNWLVDSWKNAVNTVVGWFNWLYNHNYYFKALVDAIRSVVGAVVSWLVTAWQHVTTWIAGNWNWLANQASAIWKAVSGAISTATNSAVNFLHGVWSAVIGWLSGVWATISSKVSQGWATISGIFASAWSRYIAGPLGGLGNSIAGFFSGLASQAFDWGKNVIQGIIDGINSMLGQVGDAANNVASKITGALGFHSPPKEGPAHDSDKWAPAFIDMFTAGLQAGIPKIEGMVAKLAKPMALNLNASHPTASAGPQLSSSYVPAALSHGGGGGQHITVNVPLIVNGREFARATVDDIMDYAMQQANLTHGRKTY